MGVAHSRIVSPEIAAQYEASGYWQNECLTDRVRANVAARPDALAFTDGRYRISWHEYDELSDRVAAVLIGIGLQRGECVGVLMTDGPMVHAVYVGAEKAGIIVMGIGPRAAEIETSHLLRRSEASVLITEPLMRGRPAKDFVARLDIGARPLGHLCVPVDTSGGPFHYEGVAVDESTRSLADNIGERRFGPNELFLLNSTSGTTGLPKCVMHHQNRWFYFHSLAVAAGELDDKDVFLSAIPAPFGFGLWTAHFTPTLLGAPTVVESKFSAEAVLRSVERERVSVLACVSTQFVMLLNEPTFGDHDLSSLRVMFTGGEAVSHERALEFEQRTNARVLQFYGSNETGALSVTTTRDSQERRLTTAGRVIDDMHVRLIADGDDDAVSGQPACRGPATSMGYYRDDAANDALLTEDGWMLTGDIATIDGDGYLTVIGRLSDFIIRGGKNISAVAVEDSIMRHPEITQAAAVAMPDGVFGERVCAFVVPSPGCVPTLHDLTSFLEEEGVSKEILPERLEIVAELPRSSGGKVAKGMLRDRIRAQLQVESAL